MTDTEVEIERIINESIKARREEKYKEANIKVNKFTNLFWKYFETRISHNNLEAYKTKYEDPFIIDLKENLILHTNNKITCSHIVDNFNLDVVHIDLKKSNEIQMDVFNMLVIGVISKYFKSEYGDYWKRLDKALDEIYDAIVPCKIDRYTKRYSKCVRLKYYRKPYMFIFRYNNSINNHTRIQAMMISADPVPYKENDGLVTLMY